MSDVAEAPAVAQVGAGALLRRAREASGLHVAALAVSLKVPVRKLEALEEDRYEQVGDAVFIRALASSVCRTLKIDSQPILDRLPQSAAPRLLKDTAGLNTPFRAPNDAAPPSWVDKLRQPVPLAVIVLLLGAVVVALLPIHRQEQAPVPAAASALPATPAAAPVAMTASEAAAGEAVPGVPAASAALAASPAPVVAQAAVTQPAEPASASATAAAAASGIVVFRTKGESWVEVVDAKGAPALRKIMAAGETAGASGTLPLQVTIGKVDMTEVQVRGKAFDLKPVSRDNVARFLVK